MSHDAEEVRVDEQAGFVLTAVAGARRVLEVGCGAGALAARLADAGHDVTAIDPALPDQLPARAGLAFARADLLGFDAPPFDAIAFTASLHHIAPLDAALDRAAALLAPGGRLVVDDCDLDAPDTATLRWYYGAEEALIAQGRFREDHDAHHGHAAHAGARAAEPRARWKADHAPHDGEPPLHAGAAMLAAIRARFTDVVVTRGAYLWRRLARGARLGGIAQALLAAEQAGIAVGALRRVGLRVVATRGA